MYESVTPDIQGRSQTERKERTVVAVRSGGEPGHSYLCWDTPHVLDTNNRHTVRMCTVRMCTVRAGSRFSVAGVL